MKLKSIVCFPILFFFLLVSCNSQSSNSQSSVLLTTPTLTNSPNDTATMTFTPFPYATLPPEQATEVYFGFTAVPATIEARGAKCKEGFTLEQGLYILDYSTDKWTLFTCSPVPTNKKDMWTPGVVDYSTRYTQLIKTDFSKTWTIQHSSFDYSIIDRPDALMTPFRWTADGKYLYFYPRYYPGGSGGPEFFFLRSFINDLFRINLETGEFELFLKKDEFGALAFSPNDQFLVYSEQEKPNVVHIKNMETNEDSQIEIQEDLVAIGAFIWYPDSTKVIFFAGYGEQRDSLASTAIFVLTPRNMQVQKVLAKDARIFGPYDECSAKHDI